MGKKLAFKMLDVIGTVLLVIFGLPMKMIVRRHYMLPMLSRMSDRLGVFVRDAHFYEPTYREQDLPEKTDVERSLPGIDLNEAGQLAMLEKMTFAEELKAIPRHQPSDVEYGYDMTQYGPGDAEMAYNMIRCFKPKRIIEIGSGASTLISRRAVAMNLQEDPAYSNTQTCVEPYLQPWLESIDGISVVRERVEHLDLTMFDELGENDILLIDSSHVIRPWGDVLCEYAEIIPRLKPGVLVHVHDIFTPHDYPELWLRQERRLWTEQYLLEAYLAYNSKVEVMCATNWLMHNHFDALSKACPILLERPESEPGAFWFRTG